jgi:hypothetical protein
MRFCLADSRATFSPPPPFDLGELDPAGALPTHVYAKTSCWRILPTVRRTLRHERRRTVMGVVG